MRVLTAKALVRAHWPAPAHVHAMTTTRDGGGSVGTCRSFNLATHVGDDPAAVAANRAALRRLLQLQHEPVWLEQVHGIEVIDAAAATGVPIADGSYTDRPNIVCAVLTADCLPIFLCDDAGSRVAVLHAGWRGLAAGVIEQGLLRMGTPTATTGIHAWLGPAIGPRAFEVGDEVRAQFIAADAQAASAFVAHRPGHWLADLYALARRRLQRCGVTSVHGGDACTFTDAERFYSYRRDGACGRMASLIWLAARG